MNKSSCPHCGEEIEANSYVCCYCHRVIATINSRFCLNCCEPIPRENIRCHFCGAESPPISDSFPPRKPPPSRPSSGNPLEPSGVPRRPNKPTKYTQNEAPKPRDDKTEIEEPTAENE